MADGISGKEIAIKAFKEASSMQGGFKIIADLVLPMMAEAEKNNTREATTADMVRSLRNFIDGVDVADASDIMLYGLTKDVLAESLRNQLVQDTANDAELLQEITRKRNRTLNTTSAQGLAIYQALESVMPPLLQAENIKSRQGKTPQDYVTDTRAHVAAFTPEELLAVWKERQKNTRVEAVAEEIYTLTQQCTPEKIESLLQHLRDNFNIADTRALVKNGWDAAQSILQAAQAGDFSKPEDMKAVKAFGRSLQKLFTAFETGLIAASFDVPPSLREQFMSVFDDSRLYHRAHQLKEAKHAVEGLSKPVKAMSPVRLRKPGPV